jgi:hypothetical protein
VKIVVLSDLYKLLFAKVIVANELGGDTKLIYKFSDPNGDRSGKSGWSFGICQFDTKNNPNAIQALVEMGFTNDEIVQLKRMTIDVAPLNDRLLTQKDILDKWDRQQLRECMQVAITLCSEIGTDCSCEETMLHIADYHNQLHFSRGGRLYSFLKSNVSVPIAPEMIHALKLSIDWGQSHPADVDRRYENIAKLVAQNTK